MKPKRVVLEVVVEGDNHIDKEILARDFIHDLEVAYFDSGFRDYKIYRLLIGGRSTELDSLITEMKGGG
jgi:hypothetical protein